ncbi:hypothetical protein POX_b02372 [Penicillium oxalicum]|uniref:hypothetical protein n=1 Tax=Penicillium oxalicum TaxID=69781 RepID=UPI0020B8AC0B|nr:hypothetical protein POX_b02372 [Penicillium oxalicum]KAI2792335.1 hypothetical protein POX_b02372 [Penicillium oxalicum]
MIGNHCIVTGSLLHIFSRKERAKRKRQSQEVEHLGSLPVPPAYRSEFHPTSHSGPRSAHPRPLSSFAPTLDSYQQAQLSRNPPSGYHPSHPPQRDSRAAYQYHGSSSEQSAPSYQQTSHGHSNHLPHHSHSNPHSNRHDTSRTSVDVPGYPALPTYDPSKYPPIQPSGTDSTADRFAWNPLQSHGYPPGQGQSSRLSEVHYHDARPSSMYVHPPRIPNGSAALPVPQHRAVAQVRNQPPIPSLRHGSMEHHRAARPGDGRERSLSEPMPVGIAPSHRGPRRPKPVLSRLITNFGNQ